MTEKQLNKTDESTSKNGGLCTEMSNHTPTEKGIIEEKKRAYYRASGWTIAYILLFPFLRDLVLCSAMIFDNPKMPEPIGLWYMFLVAWIPLSVSISIFLMWLHYSRGHYEKVRFSWQLTFLIPVAGFLITPLWVFFISLWYQIQSTQIL